jgi:hypothetical protein
MQSASSSRPNTPTPSPVRSLRRPVATSRRSPRNALLLPRRLGSLDGGAGVHLDPFAAEHLGDELGYLGLLGARQAWAHLDDRDPHPEAAHDLPDLEGGGPAPDDEERRRHRLGGDRSPIRPVRHAGEQRRDEGTLAGGEDEGATRRHRAAGDLDRPGAGDLGPAPDEVATLVLEAIHGHRVVPGVGGFCPDAPGDRRPVGCHDGRARHAGDPPSLGQEVSGAHHHFGGDAPPVRALAADELGLDADDLETGVGQVPCDLLTARAEPDDDGVDLHRIYSPPQLVIWTGATIGVPTTSWIW